MSPRQRKEINRPLPSGMRNIRKGYYTWTHPETGVEYGLGRNRQKAIREAQQANAHVAGKRLSLLERITGATGSWSAWCDEFEKILAERESKPNTKRTRKSLLKRLRSLVPADTPAARVETKHCAAGIDALKAEGKYRMAQSYRSFQIDSFKRMIAKGWRKDNPAEVTDEVKVRVKRARLTLEVFLAVYRATQSVWLRNSMALAIVSAQARENVADAEFADIRDGHWWNERGKTGARVAIPLAIRLHAFGMSLEEVVKQCRATGIVSRHLIHQTKRAKGARLGKKMHVDMITRVFSAELSKLKLDWSGKRPPTFHEIRSLAERLYKAQGDVNTQDLLAHKEQKTTDKYHDPRGEWVRVEIKGTN